MAGVPEYLEISLEGLKLKSEDGKSILGKEIEVRISKAHYRFHTFVVKEVYGQDPMTGSYKICMERKSKLQEKEGGEAQ